MKISAYAAAAVAALCLAVAGCSDDEEPTGGESPTTSPSASTTTANEPAQPELPPAARKKTAAGAEAFVKYYWAVVDYSQESGDVEPLKDASLSSCSFCSGGIAALEDMAEAGASFSNDPTRVSARSAPLQIQHGAQTASLSLRVAFSRATYDYGPGDERTRETDPYRTKFSALAIWSPGDQAWRMGYLQEMK